MAHATGQDHDILTHMTGVLPPSVPVRRLQQEPRKKGQYQATLEDLEDEFATRGGLAGMEDERAFRQPAAEEEAKPKRRRIAVTPNQTAVLQAMLAQTAFPTTAERDALSLQLEMPPRKVQVWFQNQRQTLKRLREEAQENNNGSTSAPASTRLHGERAKRPTVPYRYTAPSLPPFDAASMDPTPPPRPLEPWPPLSGGWSLPSAAPQQPLHQYTNGSAAFDTMSSNETGLRGFTLPPLSMILGAAVPSHLANSPHPHTSRSTTHSSSSSSSGFSRSDTSGAPTPVSYGTTNLAPAASATMGSTRSMGAIRSTVFEYFPSDQRSFGDAYPSNIRATQPRLHQTSLPLPPPSHQQQHWNVGLTESTYDAPLGDSWKYPAAPQASREWNDDQDWRTGGNL